LTALEARAEATARDQARVIAQLEEKIEALSGEPAEQRPAAPRMDAVAEQPAPKDAGPREPASRLQTVAVMQAAPATEEPAAQETRPAADALAIAPLPLPVFSKEEMADVLQSARDKARAAAALKDEDKPKDKNRRLRWFAFGALSLLVLFVGIGFTLGNSASATQNDRMADWQGSGVTHRHVTQGALAQTIAAADYGDATAEARLALAYLRGQGVARDAGAALRWSRTAAANGMPAAQYLLGALYQQGEAVKADPAQAFAWFSAAASHGNLKAMHNLGIAYAEGLGTAKDEQKAAQWFTAAAERGYVDSAFDLAVMYERGAGVTQDPRQALKWYAIAAHAGDHPSRARADFLRGQMKAEDAKLAANAALAFAPLPALASANTL
ncbi:MAG TPA: tetratricopeptide repeat protein, partial [Rhizomicrobium sp.]|nr:tetratricopeptide repeat protein [Rhizomicrobium sp.]